jgi:metal-responsive CopG/Arc/MetJ family transcriptional regulator
MRSTIPGIKKSRGRPKTNSTGVMVRLEPPLLAKVDKIAEKAGVSRPEAIRKMIDKA